MQYILGIDSGGTKYLVRAAALDGTILGEYWGSTCSHYSVPAEEAAARIDAHLTACLATFGGRREDCAAIVCGTTGYDSEEDGAIIAGMYARLTGFRCPVCCMNDVELAHYITTGGTGVLMLAGTGSIAFGRNRAGKEMRLGGWPAIIMGEEGSGRFIDAWALNHYSRYLDGFRPFTPLIAEIQEKIGSATRKGLMDYAMTMTDLPGLGACVTRAAERGDRYAQEILDKAGESAFHQVEELIVQLGMEQDAPLTVGVWGSVLMNSAPMFRKFRELLLARFPQATVSRPTLDAAQGAVELALRWHRVGGDCKELLKDRE